MYRASLSLIIVSFTCWDYLDLRNFIHWWRLKEKSFDLMKSTVKWVLFSIFFLCFKWICFLLLRLLFSVEHSSKTFIHWSTLLSLLSVQYIHSLCNIFRVALKPYGMHQRSVPIYLYTTECWWLISQNTDGSFLVSFVLHSVLCAYTGIKVMRQTCKCAWSKWCWWHIILWFVKKSIWNMKWLASHGLTHVRHKQQEINNFILFLTSAFHELLNLEQQSLSSQE